MALPAELVFIVVYVYVYVVVVHVAVVVAFVDVYPGKTPLDFGQNWVSIFCSIFLCCCLFFLFIPQIYL